MGKMIKFGLRFISVEATVTVRRHKQKVLLVHTIWIGPFRNQAAFEKWSTTFKEALKHQRHAKYKYVHEHVLSLSASARVHPDMDPESLPFDAAHDLYTFVIDKDERARNATS